MKGGESCAMPVHLPVAVPGLAYVVVSYDMRSHGYEFNDNANAGELKDMGRLGRVPGTGTSILSSYSRYSTYSCYVPYNR